MTEFTLTPSATLLDADPVTDQWPLPPARVFEPRPSFWDRLREVFSAWAEPWVEL